MENEYSYVEGIKKIVNNDFKELIYCSYWETDNNKLVKKYDIFENPYYYLYISPEDVEKNKDAKSFHIHSEEYITIDGKKCFKITPINKMKSEEFRAFREQFNQTYESDIPFLSRWISKNKPKYSKITRNVYFDIETIKDMSGNYSEVTEASAPVVSIACYDSFDKKYTVFCFKECKFQRNDVEIKISKNEKEMLKDFIIYIKDKAPDYMLGWNSNSYDIPYILKRMENLKIDLNSISPLNRVYYFQSQEISSHKFSSFYINIAGIGCFDLMEASQRLWLGKYCGYSLSSMSQYHLKENKIKMKDTTKAFKDDFDKLIEYNIRDVELCVKLDERLELFKSFQSFQDIISINVENTLVQSNNINSYIMQKTDRILLNSNKKADSKTFEGGLVLNSKPGIFEDCYKFDFVSMYPSIIISYNISPDTILSKYEEDCINMNDKYYFKKEEGVITKIMKELYTERLRHKKQGNKNLTLAYKLLTNSIYGQFSAPYGRFYSFDCGQAITYQGRRLISCLKDRFENNYNGSIVLGDTDSCVFHMKDKNFDPNTIITDSEEIFDIIYSRDNITNNKYIKLELEKKIDKLIIFGSNERTIKKKYVEFSNGEYKMVGLDAIKSDTQEIAKDLQKTIIEHIISGNEYKKKELDDILMKYKQLFDDSIKNKDYEYIAIPCKINKNRSTYKVNTFALKALENSHLKISMNERFLVLMLNTGSFAFKQNDDLIERNLIVNKDYMWNRILKKTEIFYKLLPNSQTKLLQYTK